MCTVTYLPIREGFILTHNRDEAPTRSPQCIEQVSLGGRLCLFPRDTGAGGAWIAAVQDGPTVCLLNGAFVRHERNPPYRRSRGLILMDFLEQPDWESFVSAYDLENIEPFTFLFFHRQQVNELRWDGQQRHVRYLDPHEPAFWCSATLYPPLMQDARERVFRQWLLVQAQPIAPEAALLLHRTGSVGDSENDYVMNRDNRVRTVSITQVVMEPPLQMSYHDLLEGHFDVINLPLLPV